jgi:prolyl-tRNA synthetase
MRLSNNFSVTYKDSPREAELANHKILLRAGIIHQFGSGFFGMLPMGHRIIGKITQIVREEINRIDGQEVSLTGMLPKDVWEETGRYQAIDGSMFRLQDRHGQDMVLNMTHEEPIVDMVRNIINSYKQLPFSMYQFQTKFRDEARPRGGLIRLREFIMKDAYSFHESEEDLKELYDQYHTAYDRIFKRIGFKNFISVESDNGMFGGSYSHEFMLITESGEDTLLLCDGCDYRANKEIATSGFGAKEESASDVIEKVSTPDQKTIEELCNFLSIKAENTAKAVIFETQDDATPVIAFIRGDLDVLQIKLETALLRPLTNASASAIKKAGAVAGSTGPMDLNYKDTIIVVDKTIAQGGDLCTGANENDFHYIHFDPKRDFLDKLSDEELKSVKILDVAAVSEGDPCPECQKPLITKRGIEIGNIFHLGTKYTKAMGFTYLDRNGKTQHPIMGCYGLGITRALGSIVEEQHDDYGMKLPITVAPNEVLMMVFNYKKPDVKAAADKLYNELIEAGVDVLMDDRDKKPGFQFKDADLIGIPLRFVISPKLIEAGKLEFSHREDPKIKEELDPANAVSILKEKVKAEYAKYSL